MARIIIVLSLPYPGHPKNRTPGTADRVQGAGMTGQVIGIPEFSGDQTTAPMVCCPCATRRIFCTGVSGIRTMTASRSLP